MSYRFACTNCDSNRVCRTSYRIELAYLEMSDDPKAAEALARGTGEQPIWICAGCKSPIDSAIFVKFFETAYQQALAGEGKVAIDYFETGSYHPVDFLDGLPGAQALAVEPAVEADAPVIPEVAAPVIAMAAEEDNAELADFDRNLALSDLIQRLAEETVEAPAPVAPEPEILVEMPLVAEGLEAAPDEEVLAEMERQAQVEREARQEAYRAILAGEVQTPEVVMLAAVVAQMMVDRLSLEQAREANLAQPVTTNEVFERAREALEGGFDCNLPYPVNYLTPERVELIMRDKFLRTDRPDTFRVFPGRLVRFAEEQHLL